jgi:general secretion pathway protein G
MGAKAKLVLVRGRWRLGRGFTLLEVMIVIAIILALAGIVGVSLVGQYKRAKIDTCRVQMTTLESALKTFNFTYDRFPTDEEGLAVLWDKSTLTADADATKWHSFTEKAVPSDVWGHAWRYKQVSTHGDEEKYDLSSDGPDGQEGTDDDLTSWPKDEENAPGGGRSSAPPSGKSGK